MHKESLLSTEDDVMLIDTNREGIGVSWDYRQIASKYRDLRSTQVYEMQR